MRILLVIHEKLNPNSGSAGSTWRMGQEYQKLGHEVTYYSFDDLPKKFSPVAKEVLFPLYVAAYINKIMAEQELDVVDASTGDLWLWAKVFRPLSKQKPLLVTRSHGLEHIMHLANKEDVARKTMNFSWKYPFYRGSIQLWQVKQSLLDANFVYLLSNQEKTYAIKELKVDSHKACVFPNGIPDSFLNLPIKPLTESESNLKIAVVSTFIPRKGINYSVPALNKILKLYPQIKVSFLGTECRECPNPNSVYSRFDPEVKDRITVVPRFNHEALPQLLAGHQIKILASLSEGFGKALVEAMACGLVPIATNTSGPSDIITHHYDGILVPPRSIEAIEQALIELIEDRVFLERLRGNAYNTAQKYSWSKITEDRLSVYFHGLYQKQCNQVEEMV